MKRVSKLSGVELRQASIERGGVGRSALLSVLPVKVESIRTAFSYARLITFALSVHESNAF